jgi:nicotinamide mononucleotide adenylyltransferase
MSTTPGTVATSSIALVLDTLTPVLEEIDRRAKRVLSSLHVLAGLDNEYSVLEEAVTKQRYIDVIQRHMRRMQTDLEVIKSIAEFLQNECLKAWIQNVANKDERNKKIDAAESIMENIKDIEKEVEKAGKSFSNENDS